MNFLTISIPSSHPGASTIRDATVGKFGFKLIDGCVVPFSFLHMLEQHFEGKRIPSGQVLSPRHLFDEEMWLDFDDNERRVALVCVVYLVSLGAVAVELSEHDDA